MEKLLCVDLTAPNETIYNNIHNILIHNTIIKEGKCINLSEEEKNDNCQFFQYAKKLDNCYYLKYNNNEPDRNQVYKPIFNNHISVLRDTTRLIQSNQFKVKLKTRTELMSVIDEHYKPLSNFNIDNDIYNNTFKFIFYEDDMDFMILNKFITTYNSSDIKQYQDLLILQFMIYNLYNSTTQTEFKFKFTNYYNTISIYENLEITDLPNRIDNIKHVEQINNIFNTFRIYNKHSKFKKPIELKTVNFLIGGNCEY